MLMNNKQKEPRKRTLFYSLFIITLLFGYGLFHYHPISLVEADQTNPVSVRTQLLNEQPQKASKPLKHPDKQAQIFHQPLESSDKQSQILKEVIALILKTTTGRELKPVIDELLNQDKIQLTDLEDGHYGESGEGCVIKEGEYYYEGFFMLLSNQLSIEETASALVHEVTHYRMIRDNIASIIKPQQKVIFFEIFAFAVQHQFMTELQQLNLVDPQKMFIGETQTVLEIMLNAYEYKKTLSQDSYDTALKQLEAYGYPIEELNRLISSRSEKECIGVASTPSTLY